MRQFLAAVSAIALLASPALAQGNGNGGGNGGGKGNGGGNAAEAGPRGGGGGNAKADRGNGGGQMKADRGPQARGNGNGNNGGRDAGPVARGNGNGNGGGNGQSVQRRVERDVARQIERGNSGRGRDDVRVVVDQRDGRDLIRIRDFRDLPERGLIAGCPPGLAKKSPACVPPGQARNNERSLYGWNDPGFWGYDFDDGRYYYDDGYLLGYGRDGRIGSYIPLLGGALSIGNPWPNYYDRVDFPDYYEQYYGLGPYDSYRYADNVIYRVDPETAAITSIAALLTGDQFSVGQRMPVGYDVYNVPYGYRDRYYDGPEANYRYSDGYIYQVDPTTQLIAAAIQLLT